MRQGQADNRPAGPRAKLSSGGPGRLPQIDEGLLVIQPLQVHQRPFACSIRIRESRATWSCLASRPLAWALAAVPSRVATSPASGGQQP
jgi:hypothetical protein